MLSFKQFILEKIDYLLEAKTVGVQAGNPADSRGKVAEGLVAQYFNGGEGKHPEDYRENGKKPETVHKVHGTYLYGKNFTKHKDYKKLSNAVAGAVSDAKEFIKKRYGIKKITRVAATSQGSEHEKETGIKDPNFKGDVVVTGDHKGADHRTGKKVAVSIKMYDYSKGKKPTNWANHGMKTLSDFSGANFDSLRDEHQKTLDKHGVSKSLKKLANEKARKEWYRALPEKKRKAIDDSYTKLTVGASAAYAEGLKKKLHHKDQNTQDNNLKSFITRSVGAAGQQEGGDILAGKTHLHHVMLKIKSHKDGSYSHHVADIPTHVANYLSHFHSLRVHHEPGQSNVSIRGTHKKTGEEMILHRTSIYGGKTGGSLGTGFRTSTTMPSEEHKDVNTDKPFSK